MKKNQTCLYYAQGRCRFGNKCHYSHQGFVEALMIRHAQSEFNKITNFYPNWNNPDEESREKLHFNKGLIDCSLSKEGIEQANKIYLPQSYTGAKKEVDIIFVSPLTRTLETARLIIKNNNLNVKHLLVLPELSEVLSKICDFSSSIDQKRKKYTGFNFSEIDRFLKENDHLKGQQQWQDAFVDMDHYSQIEQEQKYGQRYLQILANIFPTPLENSERCFNRSLRALEVMKEISQRLNAKKILVVSHNRILKYLAGRFTKGRATSFQNCEIRSIIF